MRVETDGSSVDRAATARRGLLSAVVATGLATGLIVAFATDDAQAQQDDARAAAAEKAESDVIGVVRNDWSGDGLIDSAVLMASEEGADLYIFFPTDRGRDVAPVIAKDLVWHGQGLFGQEAGLELSPAGEIVVTSQNTAIGRNRWSERITLGYRDGGMRVVRYQRSAYDTLDLDFSQECDVNMSTGEGVLNDKPISVPGGAPKLEAWTMESGPPKACEVE